MVICKLVHEYNIKHVQLSRRGPPKLGNRHPYPRAGQGSAHGLESHTCIRFLNLIGCEVSLVLPHSLLTHSLNKSCIALDLLLFFWRITEVSKSLINCSIARCWDLRRCDSSKSMSLDNSKR